MPKSFFYGDLLRDHERKCPSPIVHLLHIERQTKHFYTHEPSAIKIKTRPGEGVVSTVSSFY